MYGGGGRQRPPAVSRGQAETIGVVLVLAMTLIGATVALAFGGSVLNDARIDSQENSIEHAMTQLDSRSAMVALGDSHTQRVRLSTSGSGGYHVDPDAGWINITHHNYSGSQNEVIFNETLGAMVYESGDKTIAYQGGGVWVSEGEASRMVSPPEFHYRGATLTLPIIRLQNSASAGGSGITAEITRQQRAKRIFPNASDDYDGTTDSYINPIREGNVTVTVRSAYYDAWADYFRTRTSGRITVDHSAETVTVQLVTIGTVGEFEMPADGNSVEIRGLGDDHPITNFTIRLRPDDTDSANFANLQWTLYADEGNQEFEIHLRESGENDDPDTDDCKERDVAANIYYSDKSGDPHHGWTNDTAFRTQCDDLNGDGDNETYLEVDLVGSTNLTMEPLSSSNLNHFDNPGELKDPVTFDEHDGVAWEGDGGTEFVEGNQTTIGNLTNHYLSLMGPNIELTVEDKGSDTVNEDSSNGNFEQEGGGARVITFLHITENRVSIKLE